MSSWSFRGVSLATLGIVTLVSDSFKLPERRGSNVVIPFRNGRLFVEKYFEQRTMVLGLEVSATTLSALEQAMDTVKALFGRRSLGALTQTLEDGSVRTINAEYTGDLDPKRVSPLCVRMILEFIAPDPYFRGNVLVTNTLLINSDPSEYSITNPGTAEERDPKIVLTGPLQNTLIGNITNSMSLTYSGTIASPRVVTIQTDPDTGEYIATDDLGANVIGNITHEGSTALFALEPGENEIIVTDGTHTTGTVTIEYYPPYL